MSNEQRTEQKRSLREEARRAKSRMKNGFWSACKEDMDEQMDVARKKGLNESKAERFFKTQVSAKIAGETQDDFYLKVKKMLLADGEVSDAIGRLTDKPYYESLSYEEKQRYTLALSEKYLRALERFRKECAFDIQGKNA